MDMKKAIVIPDRNDSYKEPKRLHYVLSCHLENFDEIWFVDWNTPRGVKPWLHEFAQYVPRTGKIHHVIVTPDEHNELLSGVPNPPNLPDHYARNLAMRRTDADWIVQTNIDMFGPHPEFFDKMMDELQEDTFYTMSRRELNEVDLYRFANWKGGLMNYSTQIPERRWLAGCTPNDWYSIINCCGDFQIAHKNIWNTVKGFEDKMIYRNFGDSNIQKKAVLNRFKIEALFSPAVFHISHDYKHLHVNTCRSNDPMKWVENFGKTENTDNWGFPDREFKIEVI
jgi:hypothetical protein